MDNWSTVAEKHVETNKVALSQNYERAKASLGRKRDAVDKAIGKLQATTTRLADAAEEMTERWKRKEDESDRFKAELDGKTEEAKNFRELYNGQRTAVDKLREEKEVAENARLEAEGRGIN
ncbi:hypothetical protein LTR36_003830 [Oleoguttula mirabilis]|uniref:Uncharacterized protein n=1 Tax=Oleoguttula mirabilis TaxID=1507867 RepID=A0AAV9JK68_9PEZI|nr:hypothetical protein LTR36_003830 [Oleoguttula mirabilis]